MAEGLSERLTMYQELKSRELRELRRRQRETLDPPGDPLLPMQHQAGDRPEHFDAHGRLLMQPFTCSHD